MERMSKLNLNNNQMEEGSHHGHLVVVKKEVEDHGGCDQLGEEHDKKKKRLSGCTSGGARMMMMMMRGCQVDKCTADLSDAKQYYKKHKVCDHHSKAQVVLLSGLTQRFCQQCSRFHDLSEFDDTKRSCRRRLAGHNERRRKNPAESQAEGSSGSNTVTQLKDAVCGQADERGRIRVTIPSHKRFQIR